MSKQRLVTFSGAALEAAMKRKGLSHADLASKLGITEMSVRRYVADTTSPSAERVRAIGQILGVSWRY